MVKDIEGKIRIPVEDRATSIQLKEAEFLYEFLKARPVVRTLEIGFAYGYSAAYIIAATKSKHLVIDSHQETYGDLGVKNLAALGFADRYELKREPSHAALPALLKEGKTFQFVFIDGGHKFDQIFLDWYYSDLLLEADGCIMFHDAWMRSTQLVAEFVRKNRSDFREVAGPVKNVIVFEKVSGGDNRAWHHFEEFYSEPQNRFAQLREKIKNK